MSNETTPGGIGDGEWLHLSGAIRRSAIALAAARAEFDKGGRYFGPDDTAKVAISAALDDTLPKELFEAFQIAKGGRVDTAWETIPDFSQRFWVGIAHALRVSLLDGAS